MAHMRSNQNLHDIDTPTFMLRYSKRANELCSKVEQYQNEIDGCFKYDRVLLEEELGKYSNLFDGSFRSGYWIWKPIILLDIMKKIEKNDVVFFIAYDIDFKNDLKVIIHL